MIVQYSNTLQIRRCFVCFDVVCLFFPDLVREASIRQQCVAVQNPALKLLANSLPDCIKHSKAKNTQVKYYHGFDRWRSWASKFTEVNVLSACSIYIALFVIKSIQDNLSCHIIDEVHYGIKWVHEISGYENPCNSSIVISILGSC